MAQRYNKYYVYRPGLNSSSRAQKLNSKSNIAHNLSLGILILAITLGSYFAYSKHTQAIDSEHQADMAQAAKKVAAGQKFVSTVQGILNQNSDVTYSVAAVDITTGSSVQIGKSSAMNAASCGKVLTAALFLHKVENGQASLDARLGGYSSKYQLRQLIQKSDDNSWVLFNDQLSHHGLVDYAHKLGFSSYDPDSDSISALDMSILLQKLYRGELLNRRDTKLLLSYMQNTNYEQFITPAVPSSYNLYHKVGFVDETINDSAIISNGKQSIALTIFSNSATADVGARIRTMHDITKAVLGMLQ